MSLVPRDVAVETVKHELLGANAWAARRGWTLDFDEPALTLRCTVTHPGDGELLYLTADLADYRALPPSWRFTSSSGDSSDQRHWPKGAPIGPGKSSVFHGQPVICAPFNRLAYKDLGGPHANWGGPTNWLNVPSDHVRALTIGEMLAVIDLHLSTSPGRM